MQLDIEDIIAGAVGSVVGRFLLFVAAVWTGCSVAVVAMVLGATVEHGLALHALGWVLASPLLLFSVWALLNIPFLLISLIRYIRGEGDGYLTLGIVIGVEALCVMLGWGKDFMKGGWPLAAAWAAMLVLLVMIGAGIWLLRQYCINSWAQHIGMLRAENARKRAERESEERERFALEKES